MIINALCAGSFIYLAFVLLLKSSNTNTLANRWLALFLVFVSFLQLDDALMMSGTYLKHPHLFNIFDLFIFGVAPALYFAVFHFVQASRQFHVRSLWHFVPCFLVLILNIPAFLESKGAKLELIKAISISDKTLNVIEIVIFTILFLQCVVYLLLGYIKILRHQKNLQLVSSNQAGTDLNWLKNFWYGISILLLLWIIEIAFYTNFLGGEMSWAYWVGTFYLGAYAIQQKEIYPFVDQDLAEIEEIIQEKNLSRVDVSEINPLQKEQLLQLMSDHKPYLDPELSLPKLAQLMHCSTHELSHLINQGFERNFYQFINTYRIEESKRLLQDQKLDHLNILAIGFEAGFNSKTTFNTTFKQMVGMSPVEFRKRKLMA